ncbi:MAG TPA: hypothetical protein VFW06_11695 [Acidimicrobiia bacterium]|nr:hypothetical protein [Acidimicrobiia bacterium]
MRVRRRGWFAAGLLAVTLAGCAVDATVTVRVREDGSGTVRVAVRADPDAVTAVELGGVPIDDAVRLADLADAGWSVGSWVRADDGSATLELETRFDNVSEVAAIVRELNGDLGPLPRLRASRDAGLLATRTSVTGSIDLAAAGSGVADDAELSAALVALGVDVGVVDEQLRAQVQSSFGLEVVVRLPGEPPVTFAPKGDATSAAIDASASVRNTERVLYLVAAVGFLLLAGVVWIRGGRRRRGRRGGRRAAPARSAVAASASSSSGRRQRGAPGPRAPEGRLPGRRPPERRPPDRRPPDRRPPDRRPPDQGKRRPPP